MIQLLYFARLREQLGCATEALELEPGECLRSLRQRLRARGEPWQSALAAPNLLVAVNQQLTTDDLLLHDGDEVGFFPPVTGG